MDSAMILNGENRGALATARSLGKRGIKIIIGSTKRPSQTHFSRYCDKSFYYFDQDENDLQRTHQGILKEVIKQRPRVLFPIGNVSSYVVFKHAKEYEKYCSIIPNPGLKKFLYMNDKMLQLRAAKKYGCPVPRTYIPHSFSEVQALAPHLEYPVLIKPTISSGGAGIIKVRSAKQLLQIYQPYTSQEKKFFFDGSRPMIQEFIQGYQYGVVGIFERGEEIISLVSKTLWHYPEFGPPVVNQTISNNLIRDTVLNMLRRMKWHGPFAIQLMLDEKDGLPKLVDFNPRYWPPVASTIAAGLDVPYMLYSMALGKKVQRTSTYALNQIFRFTLCWEIPTLRHSKNRLGFLKTYFGHKKVKTDIDLMDPIPHLVHFYTYLRHGRAW